MAVLLIDNHDSFTYNLVQLIEEVETVTCEVVSSEALDFAAVETYSHIVFSPGPALPDDFPIMKAVLSAYGSTKAILGVCLGHQTIAEYFGARLLNMRRVVHGQQRIIQSCANDILFANLPNKLQVGLYHSWVVDKFSLPSCLQLIAVDTEGRVMAIKHREYALWGVQFHPESIMTPMGKQIIRNFLSVRS